jgi:hypothetical protein
MPAEFLDVIGIKVLRVFLLAIHSHLHGHIYYRILPPLPPPIVQYTETSSLRTLKIMTSTKLYVHEFGFGPRLIHPKKVSCARIVFIFYVYFSVGLYVVQCTMKKRIYVQCMYIHNVHRLMSVRNRNIKNGKIDNLFLQCSTVFLGNPLGISAQLYRLAKLKWRILKLGQVRSGQRAQSEFASC